MRSTLGGEGQTLALLTVREVAATLRVSEKTVRRLVARGQLPFLRVGSQLRFSAVELLRWAGHRKEGA